jgi:outer membrane receptor for monomeric catechols
MGITPAAAFLVCVAGGTLAADAGTYRSVRAPDRTNATHRVVSRLHVRKVMSGQRSGRSAWYSPNGPRGSSRAAPAILKPPGMSVVNRRYLDDINATTLRGALRYTPGVIAR